MLMWKIQRKMKKKQIPIDSRDEYNYAKSRGFLPLLEWRFDVEINLRIKIQNELFGFPHLTKNKVPKANEKFYHWMWRNKINVCEETGMPLYEYNPKFISHLLSRGAYPEMAHDPRNINILNPEAHHQWENGNRKQMLIWRENKRKIEILKTEYAYGNR